MAVPHSIDCANCGTPLQPSGYNGRFRKTQRFCGLRCARARQVIVRKPALVRLWKHVVKGGPVPAHRPDLGPCWLWTGTLTSAGYGHINNGGGVYRMAHVVSYETAKGPVPGGLELDHLCRNRACVNPDHLEAVTHRVNVLRGVAPTTLLHNSGTCAREHPSDERNAYRRKTGPRAGQVAFCRACRREDRAAVRQRG